MNVVTKIRASSSATSIAVGLSGTANIRTPCGLRRVENVRAGDLVVTRDNGLQPVRMVWSRIVTAAEIAADPSLAPVRLKPRAIGPMMPQRDLLVGGEHRILVPGYRLADMPDTTACLLAARDIAEASDQAYFDRSVTEITLYNIVFDAHQVFVANGLPVESYAPTERTLPLLDKDVVSRMQSLFPDASDLLTAMPATKYPAPEPDTYRPEFV